MPHPVSRRQVLATGVAGAITAEAVVGHAAETAAKKAAAASPTPRGWRYCLNTATLRGQKLTLPQLVDVARRAGFQAIEPWIEEIDRLVAAGGSLKDLGKHIADSGLTVEGAIGFAQWCVDDPNERKKGLEEARRTMGLVSEIGGRLIAAPPAGAKGTITPAALAERYRALLELGEQTGVVPIAEFWGPVQVMNQLGVTTQIAIDSRPQRCLHPGRHLSPVQRRLPLRRPGPGLGPGDAGAAHERLSGQTRPVRNHRRRPGLSGRRRGSLGRDCRLFAKTASPASCRWSSSTATIGNKIR